MASISVVGTELDGGTLVDASRTSSVENETRVSERERESKCVRVWLHYRETAVHLSDEA